MDTSKIDSVLSSINNAKVEIDSLSSSIQCEKSKEELGLAYNSLNDTINHCNTIKEKSNVNSVVSNMNHAKTEIESLSNSAQDEMSKEELNLAHNSLKESVSHFDAVLEMMQKMKQK